MGFLPESTIIVPSPIDLASAKRKSLARPLLLIAICLISLFSLKRGQRNVLEPFGLLYYVIDYSDGLIRRGLIGQLFLSVYARTQTTQVWQTALLAHGITIFLICAGLLVWVWARLWNNSRFAPATLIALFVLFAAGQFLPTLAVLTTYLDSYILLLLLCGFVLAARRHHAAAACIGFIGPFVHEMFVVLWVSLGCMMVWRDGWRGLRRPGVMAVCSAAMLGTVILLAFESREAVAAQVARAPLPAGLRDAMLHQQMSNSLLGSLRMMSNLFAMHPRRACISIVLFLAPTLAMLAVATLALRRRATMALALATLAPVSLLIVGFDLSRFVTMTSFVGMLCILFMAETPTRSAPRALGRPAMVAASGLAAALLLLPLFYGYFDKTIMIGTGVLGRMPVLGGIIRTFYATFSEPS